MGNNLMANFLRHVAESSSALMEQQCKLDAFRREIEKSRQIIADSRALIRRIVD